MKRLFLAAAAALTLAACSTPTPYQPLQTGGVSNGGYTDTRISSDRFRVSFQGNTITDRDTVERYLLYRAAEITREAGYDWFAMVDRDTERQAREYVTQSDPFGYAAWRPTWYYLGNGRWTVVHQYDPWLSRPYYERRTVDQYRATAEIFLGRGEKPANDPKAFDAREVMANLGPTLRYPERA
jgi:hypothetical protein